MTTELTRSEMTQEEMAEYEALVKALNKQDGDKAFNFVLASVRLDGAGSDRFKASDGEKYGEITGIIVVARKARSYWIKPTSKGNMSGQIAGVLVIPSTDQRNSTESMAVFVLDAP